MRLLKIVVGVTLLFVSGPVARTYSAEPTAETVWKIDFAAAQAEAKAQNRPLVVHFHSGGCIPCRRMEREVLHTPQALKLLENGFVAVKVNLDNVAANSKYQTRYNIDAVPTDLILSPEGKVLARASGYSPELGDKDKYLGNLKRIGAQYAAERQRIAQSTPPAKNDSAIERPEPKTETVASTAGQPGDKLVPDPIEPRLIGEEPARTAGSDSPAPSAAKIERPQPVVAMDGYCPVTLRTTRTWKAGSKELSIEHEGQIFRFTDSRHRDEFRSHPARYAPRLLGCDPVVLAESDLAVRGSTKYGAYYEGELFLFETAESRAKFRKEPARYSKVKHVLKPEDVKRVASASTN